MLDDLRHALLEAGAVTVAANNFVRIPTAVNKAVEKLALGDSPVDRKRFPEDRAWFVSAPGKVILFGEHAVVHGVVRFSCRCLFSFVDKLWNRLRSLLRWT